MKFVYESTADLGWLRSVAVAMALSLVIGPWSLATESKPMTNDQEQGTNDKRKATNDPAMQERIQEIKQRIDGQLSSLETLYKDIHSHPELSLKEEHTSARLAQALRELTRAGHVVTCYEAGSQIGGMWRYGNDNGVSAAYASLHTNTPGN